MSGYRPEVDDVIRIDVYVHRDTTKSMRQAIFAMLRDGRADDPHHDQKVKEVYSQLRKAA